MPFIKIWIHAVWSTKNRVPLLKEGIRKSVIDHIKANAKEKGIYLDCTNGHLDHLHLSYLAKR
ncbi:MAG: transposase [Bacteroidota bacterium]